VKKYCYIVETFYKRGDIEEVEENEKKKRKKQKTKNLI